MLIFFLCVLCVVCVFMVFFDTCAPIPCVCVYVLCSASADTVLADAHVAMASPSVEGTLGLAL